MTIETIRVTVTREEMKGPGNDEQNVFIAGITLLKILLRARIPVMGISGFVVVARGKLTVEHEDGLDGDEWHYTFVGEPIAAELMDELLRSMEKGGGHFTFTKPLAEREAAVRARLAEDEEL